MKKIKCNKEDIIYYSELLICIILSISLYFLASYGGDLIKNANSIDEYFPIQDETYDYRILVSDINGPNSIILNDAYIEQDFSKEIGRFSFVLDQPYNVSYILFNFPLGVSNSTIRCYIQNRSDYENKMPPNPLLCNPHQNGNKTIELEFDRTNFYEERILIEYNLPMLPNGFFLFTIQQTWNAGRNGNIILKLGNQYECIDECLYYLNNIKLSASDSFAERHLTFENPSEKRDYSFKLLTKSKRMIDNKNLLYGGGIAILSGSIFSFITILIYLLQIIFSHIRKNLR